MSVNSRLKAIYIIGQRKAFHRQRIPESNLHLNLSIYQVCCSILTREQREVSIKFVD